MHGEPVFVKQPNSWTCGPAALRNGLVQLLGPHVPSVTDLEWDVDADREGTTAQGMAFGAALHGARIERQITRDADAFYQAVRAHGGPVLLMLGEDGEVAHWVVTERATSRHVWIADSLEEPVLQRQTWRQLGKSLVRQFPEGIRFDLYLLSLR